MNVRLIQSQWGIAIVVIANEHRAALMLQRCSSLPAAMSITGEVKYYDVTCDSGGIVSRGFCPTCGARLFGKPLAGAGIMDIMVGSLDDPSWVSAPSGYLHSERAAMGPHESGYPEISQAAAKLVWCPPKSLNNLCVIPGKLAIASATRNPGKSKTSGYPLSRV